VQVLVPDHVSDELLGYELVGEGHVPLVPELAYPFRDPREGVFVGHPSSPLER
jgi:hypothetical protein